MPESQYDMIAAQASSLFPAAALAEKIDNLCDCIQSYAQQPGVQPCETFPFNISGSIVQTAVCHIQTFVMQVPNGVDGVITRISLQEQYPGTLYGANFMLGINDNLAPEFPRIDNPVGQGIQNGIVTRICLQEQDLVWILLQCSWTPVVFSGIDPTYQQTKFPFEVAGFYQYKQTVCCG